MKDINNREIQCDLSRLVPYRPEAIKEGAALIRPLLVDYILFEPIKDRLFEQAVAGSGKLIVKGILQRAGVQNQNGRVYPREVLAREVGKYAENFINERRALGELDHPQDSVVNLRNVSHNVLEVHWEGDNLVGSVEVLDTPNGNILRNLLKGGIRLGISSRGLGTVRKTTTNEGTIVDMVENDFELIAFDFVSNPSTNGAFMFPTSAVAEGRRLNESVKKNIATAVAVAQNILQN